MGTVEKPWGQLILDGEGAVVGRIIRDRSKFVIDDEFSLEPDTLVGSWFLVLSEGQIVWKGVIVGEPQAGRYLCEIDVLEPAAEHVQRIFSLDTLMGLGDEARRLLEGSMADARAPVIDPVIEWRLYDNEEEAMQAFIKWSSKAIQTTKDHEHRD